MNSKYFLQILFCLFCHAAVQANPAPALLSSTESDLDSYIANVNVINGDYCESTTDLQVTGADSLALQRTFNAKNYITGQNAGGWRVFSHLFLVLGNDKDDSSYASNGFDRTSAFTGEPSGGILTYSGWRKHDGTTQDPLKIDLLTDGAGIVNTHAQEISARSNRQNNVLHCKGETCEVILGDGTRRIYKKVNTLPSLLLGEELNPVLAKEVNAPAYFRLAQEILPSNNQCFYSYDSSGHLDSIEMTNANQTKVNAWVRFYRESNANGYHLKVVSSDKKNIDYDLTPFKLANGSTTYALTQIKGSHLPSCHFDYQVKGNLCLLVKKTFQDGRTVEIDYDQSGKVKAIREPYPQSGKLHKIINLPMAADIQMF